MSPARIDELRRARGLGPARLVLLAICAEEAGRIRREGARDAPAALVELARVALAMQGGWHAGPSTIRAHRARAIARAWVLLREAGPEAAAAALEVDAAEDAGDAGE